MCMSICTQTYLYICINTQTYSSNESAYIRRPCKDFRKVHGLLLQRQKRQDGSEWGDAPSAPVSVCVSLPAAPQPIKVHAISCEVQSIPVYKHTVYEIERKMFCMRQEKLLREILWLQLCGSGLVINMVSSVLQISELDS